MQIKTLNNPLSKKIMVSILLASGVLTFIFTIFQMGYEYQTRVGGLERNLEQVEKTYAPAIKNALWAFDEKQIQILLDSLVNIPHVRKTELISFDTKRDFMSGKINKNTKYPIQKTIPLNYEVNAREFVKLGHLIIYAERDYIVADLLNKSLLFLSTQFIKTLLISLFILGIVFLMVIQPMQKVRSYLDSLNFKHNIEPLKLHHKATYSQGSENEIHHMQESINKMVERINEGNEFRERTINERIKSSKLQAIGVLTSGVAHDFNNILQGLINLNYLNLKKNQNMEVEKYLQKNFQFLDRGKSLVDSLLLFSRDKRPELEPVDLIGSLKEVVELGRVHRFGEIEIELEYNLERAWVLGSKLLLYQVFTNIVANACDAIEDPKNGKILIRIFRCKYRYLVEIIDNGPGMPAEVVENIFDPFFTTKEVGKGTGLGLSIVYGIINDLKGDIRVSSKKDIGTTFSIELPHLSAEDLKQIEPINQPVQRELSPAHPESDQLRDSHYNKMICLIDDEADILEINKSFLEDEGLVVQTYTSAKKFFEFFENQGSTVSMVITDFNMPEYSGDDVRKFVKSIHPSIPVLLVSGYIEGDIDLSDFEGHLVKPIAPQTLIETIKNTTV